VFNERANAVPIGVGLKFAGIVGGARIPVVDKRHVMPDEDLILYGHALADEGVTRDLASAADARPLLNFDKRTDLRVIPDLTSIQIREIVNPYAFA
jgi:hypothetical protein